MYKKQEEIMSKIERKRWFELPVLMVAILYTFALFRLTGVQQPESLLAVLDKWFVFGLTMFGLQRLISFYAWLVVLQVPPKLAAQKEPVL
jgi:hypothetical protein